MGEFEDRLAEARTRAKRASSTRAATSRSAKRASGKGSSYQSVANPFGNDDGGTILGNISQGVKDIATGAIPGLAGLGSEAWDSTIGNLGAIVARRSPTGRTADDVRQDSSLLGSVRRLLVNEDTMGALDDYEAGTGSGGDAVFAATPLPRTLGRSLSETGGRVAQQAAALAPGGMAAGDTDYAEAFRNNRLLPLLVEDVGNAALVGSAVAKPLAAGGRAAARATGNSTVARAAAKTGDIADMSRGIDEAIGKAIFQSPIRIPNRAVGMATGRTIGDRLASGGRRVAQTERYQKWRESPRVRKVLDETFAAPRARALGARLADDQQTAAFDSDQVLEALRDVTDVVGDMPELGIAAMMEVGQVNRLLPSLADLDEATFARLIGPDGALKGLSDTFDESAIRSGIQIANRYLKDPDAIDPAVRARIDAAADIWGERVLPLMEERFLAQVGRRDEVHPDTVQMLAGDDLLPYEELKVIGDHVARERTLTKRRDTLAEAVGGKEARLGIDEGIFADPIRVLRERAGDIERAIDDLFDTEGLSGVVDLLGNAQTRLDLDALGDTPTPAQMDRLRDELRRQIDARAGAMAMGKALPNDPITDMVLDMGLGQVIRPRARSSRAAIKGQRSEGARRQAATDTGRLDARVGRLEVKAADLAEILHDALTPKVNVGLGKMRASIRREAAASKSMGKAAGALTRIKNRLQSDTVKTADLAKDVRTFRAEARTVLTDMLSEARDRAHTARSERLASLSDEWERLAARDTIGVSGPDGWAAVEGGLRRAGYFGDPRDVKIDGRRVFVDANRSSQAFRAADDVAAEAQRYQNYADGTESGFLESFAADVVAPAAALQVNTVTKSKGVRRRGKRGADGGDTSLYAEAPIDELLLSDLTPARILDELLDDPELLASVFDDPEMVAALSGDEASAVEGLRALRAQRWEGEDFAEAVETGELLRAIDEEAADLAAGDPRSILASDETPTIGATGRSAARDAYDGDLGKAAEAGYDIEAGRRDLERRAKERARAERTALNRAGEKGARAAEGPARQTGRMEGRASEATREGRLAETRAARANDADVATAEGFAEAQGAAFDRGAKVGVRKADLDRTRAALAKVEAELKGLDEGLLDRLTEAREKVTSAPAKYRIAIQFARDLDSALDDILEAGDVDAMTAETLARIKAEIVTSTVDALDAMDSPGMLFGGRVRGDAPKLQNVRSAAASKSSAEYLKEGVLGPVSPADQALLAVREIQRAAQTQTAKWMVDTYGKRADELVPELFDEGRPTGRQIAEAVDALADTPLVPLDIRRWMAEKGGNLPENQLGADTMFVPEWAVDAFTSSTKKISDGERMMRDWFDRPTRWWKHGVLALSPTWHTGNSVGNSLMAWAGGVNPARQVELMGDALAMINRARRGEFLPGDAPRRMYGTGQAGENLHMMGLLDESESGLLTRSEMRALGTPAETRRGRARQSVQRAVASDPMQTRPSRIGRAVDRTRDTAAQPIRTSYEFNGFIDDLTHAIVYLDRTTKGIDSEVALRDSLRVAGDFSRLTPFERRFVRRALPFYSWMRHITTLTADLAVNHPLRTAWTLHLWTMAVPEDTDLYSDIPALAGSVATGPNQFLRLANLFPFGAAVDVGEGASTDPLALLGASANPLAKLGLEGMTGLEFGPGGLQPLSRPFGSANTDAYGNEKLGPIGWGAFGQRATRLLPQTRGIRELLRDKEDRVVRYDTGQEVTIDGRTIPDVNRRDAGEIIARDLLRVPIFPPIEMDPAAIRARRADKMRNR